jgi:hypothetical protein
MTSKSATDIKDGGGTCEKAGVDFWECTDKDGKKWWCSDGGKTCIEAPTRVGIRDDHLDDVTTHLNEVGADKFKASIRDAARRGIATQGRATDRHGTRRLTHMQKDFVAQTDHLLLQAADAHNWNPRQIAEFAHHMSWAMLAAEALTSTIARDNSPGGTTPATACREQYDQCMLQNNCTRSLICICCIPCSLEYIGCMRHVFGGLGGRGPVIA